MNEGVTHTIVLKGETFAMLLARLQPRLFVNRPFFFKQMLTFAQ
jgi:hypothetical protein